ncbi:hypothetical protein KP509_01G060900 [Ceratopteris richardii]|nr:hypothetical protein KP509_01G060900 [Ceratopteris richardii]
MELAQSFKQFHLNVVPLNENSHALRLARGARNFQPSSEDTEEALEAAEMDKFCPICLEKKKKNEMLEVSGCHHGFCRVCVIQHMEVKIQAGQVPVRCPHVNCTQTFSLSECQSILSQKWTDILNKRLIEINMPESERVYCPFPKCSALMNRKDLVSNHDGASSSSSFSQSLAPSRCMECFRLFCMDCRVLWHTNMTCREYQQLPLHLRNAQDAKLQQLAMKQRWQRCGKCSRMIELAEGCYHMTCWCGYQFCYLCGEPWKNDKQSCKCRLWDEDYLLEGPLTESDSDEWEGSVDGSDDLAADYEDWQDLVDLNTRVLVDTRIPIIHDRYYKTKLCRYWERGCYMGEDCRFAHGEAELRGI